MMHVKKFFLPILLFLCTESYGQYMPRTALEVGDPAPGLRVSEWIKGDPIQAFQQGHIYVLEFWATWCKPCIAAMPHLSQLAATYRHDVTFIGVDVYENERTSMEDVRQFVKKTGGRMEYPVAVDDNKQMVENWLVASEEVPHGIPRTFIVNREGRIAWIGYPHELATVLKQVVSGDWNEAVFSEERNQARYLDSLSNKASYIIRDSKYDAHIEKHVPVYGTPELQLRVIDSLIGSEPALAMASVLVNHKLHALLDLDQNKAYHYAKGVLEQIGYGRQTDQLIEVITEFSGKSRLMPQIYLLAAQAYTTKIAGVVYPELEDIPAYYAEMAYFYWLGQETQKAVSAQEKAIELRHKQSLTRPRDLELMQEQLMKYMGEL